MNWVTYISLFLAVSAAVTSGGSGDHSRPTSSTPVPAPTTLVSTTASTVDFPTPTTYFLTSTTTPIAPQDGGLDQSHAPRTHIAIVTVLANAETDTISGIVQTSFEPDRTVGATAANPESSHDPDSDPDDEESSESIQMVILVVIILAIFVPMIWCGWCCYRNKWCGCGKRKKGPGTAVPSAGAAGAGDQWRAAYDQGMQRGIEMQRFQPPGGAYMPYPPTAPRPM